MVGKLKKTKKNEIEGDLNIWSIFYFNPTYTRETWQFRKEITKVIKKFSPMNSFIEELTSFMIFNTSINTGMCSDIIPKESNSSIDEYNELILRKIKEEVGIIYEKYMREITSKFANEMTKNKELHESSNNLVEKLKIKEEMKRQFQVELSQSIIERINAYLEVIKNSIIIVLDHKECDKSLIAMGNKKVIFQSEKDIVRLIDELILTNFSRDYVEKTIHFFENFNLSIKEVNNELTKWKKISNDIEETTSLLKGKSFEIVDNIHDIRRQLARQNRAEDVILSEMQELKNDSLSKAIIEDIQKENIQNIIKETENANEKLTEWFQILRNVELIDERSDDIRLPKETIAALLELFIQMELIRIWSELFYDISYFTIRKGKVVKILDEKIKAQIETDAVLVVDDVYKTYKLQKSQVYALRGVSFEINPGEFLAIMGPSGAGKTTLVNILTGLDSPDKGAVYLNGRNIALMDDKELTEYRRDKIGLVFQFYQLFAELTAVENVAMPAEMAGLPIKEARKKALEILKIVELEKFGNQYPDKLSGGQQQRVAIARALINDPILIVADQLTGDLDSVTGQQIIGYLRKINQERGATILLVTHNKAVATQADRILMIEDGEITEEVDMKILKSTE